MGIRCVILGHKFTPMLIKAGAGYTIKGGGVTIQAIDKDVKIQICQCCERIRIVDNK